MKASQGYPESLFSDACGHFALSEMAAQAEPTKLTPLVIAANQATEPSILAKS